MLVEDGRVDGKISKKPKEELAALNRDPTYTKPGGDGQKRSVGYSVFTNSYGELLMYVRHITDIGQADIVLSVVLDELITRRLHYMEESARVTAELLADAEQQIGVLAVRKMKERASMN